MLAASVLGVSAELERRQSCSALHYIHAAGTTEMGLGVLGGPMSRNLASIVPGYVLYYVNENFVETWIGRTTTSAVMYSTIAEYFVTVQQGAATAVNIVRRQAAACPNQRFVLSGYSKGALVLHREYRAKQLFEERSLNFLGGQK